MDQKNIPRMSFIWNAMYAGFNALQSSIILFAIARNRELNEAGIITIGFTIAALVMIIARFGIRNYQVTDVMEEFGFSDYLFLRFITVLGALVATIMYIVTMVHYERYSVYKGLVVLAIVILKLVDAFEGVYVGRLQQKGRLDVGARIATVRIVVSTAVIFILTWVVNNTLFCFFMGILVSIITDMIMIPMSRNYADFSAVDADRRQILRLFFIAVPLCLGTALHNYIGNAPKYLVDYFLSDEMQAISGYIMMPMFVITVLNSFLMQPTVKSLGDAWNDQDMKKMHTMIVKHISYISAAAVCVLLMGIFIGLPFLSWMYKVELTGYKNVFSLIMIGGTIYTLSSYAMVLLTAMRNQRWIVYGCIVSIVMYLCLGRVSVGNSGLLGAAYLYIASNVALLAVFCIGMGVKKTGNEG